MLKAAKWMENKFVTRLMAPVTWAILSVVVLIYLSHENQLAFLPLLFAVFNGILLSMALRQIERYRPFAEGWRKWTLTRFTLGYIIFLVLSLSTAALSLSLYLLATNHELNAIGFAFAEAQISIKFILLMAVTALGHQLQSFVFYSYRDYSRGQLKRLEAKRERIELRYELLKDQLSPHFLFNSLNAISLLIYKDPEKAEEFTRRMAACYRYVLENREVDLVPLGKEIAFCQAYQYLLAVRFENALIFRAKGISPKETEGMMIPPMTLQILLENAVKHNSFSHNVPLTIEISLSGDRIVVSNELRPSSQTVPSHKVGLENIRKRLAHLSDNKIKIESQDGKFTVSVPLIASAHSNLAA